MPLDTFDINDVDVELLKRCVRSAASVTADEADGLLWLLSNPTCSVGERIVTSATAFREFFDTGNEDEQWALAQADDALINSFLEDGAIYDAWAQACDSAMTELLHHLNKVKADNASNA